MTVIEPSGPTDHLETVDYWKGLYLDAVVVGQEMLTAVKDLHARRTRDHNGFTEVWCRECNQDWPCPTIKAVSLGGTEKQVMTNDTTANQWRDAAIVLRQHADKFDELAKQKAAEDDPWHVPPWARPHCSLNPVKPCTSWSCLVDRCARDDGESREMARRKCRYCGVWYTLDPPWREVCEGGSPTTFHEVEVEDVGGTEIVMYPQVTAEPSEREQDK